MKKQKNWPVANLDEIIFSSSFTEVVRKEEGREWFLKNTLICSLLNQRVKLCQSHILQLFFKLKLLLQSTLDYLEFQKRSWIRWVCHKVQPPQRLVFIWGFPGALLFGAVSWSHYCTLFYYHIPHASVECHTHATSRLTETERVKVPFLLSTIWDSKRAAQ